MITKILLPLIFLPLIAADIHVDSSAPAGGNGSLTSPYKNLSQGQSDFDNGDTLKLKGSFGVIAAYQKSAQ